MATTSACRRADPARACGRRLRAGRGPLLCIALAVLLAACASPPRIDRIDRLPSADTAADAPLSADEIVRLAKAGASPEAIVGRWREDGARLKPTAALLLDLHARGLPPSLLDALLDAREQAVRTDADSRLAELRARFDADLAAERARPRVCPPPAGVPYLFHPHGGWLTPGGRRGGVFLGR